MFQTLSSSSLLAGSAPSSMSYCRNHPCHASLQALAEPPRKAACLYEVLRLKQTASPMEIKTAYRSLAKMYHPDASPLEADGRDFIQIRNAYETLSDPAARAVYDMSLGAAGRRSAYGYSSGGLRGVRSGFNSNRRWETDQCW